MKARDKYQKLSQKMEFEMIMGQEKVDFQQFKAELQKDVGQELLRKVVTLKPNQNFDHHMQTQVKSYQQIVRQLSSHSTKYQMPEYVRKVRQDYEEKQKTISNQLQLEEYQQQQEKAFEFKNKKLSSRATSTQTNNQSLLPQDRLFSPRISLATHSHRTSQMMGNYMDKLKLQLQDTQLKAEPIDQKMLMRPQFKSEHIQLKKKTSKQGDKIEQVIVNKKKIKQNRISRMLNKQPTQILPNKCDTLQSEQKIPKTIQDLNIQQQLVEIRIPTIESILQQQISQKQVQFPVLCHLQIETTEQSENHLYTELLNKYTIEQLNLSARIIQICFRRYKCNIKKITTTQTIDLTPITTSKPQSHAMWSEKFDSIQTNRSNMKVSVNELKNSIRKGARFDQIVKELKTNEVEQISTNKAKTLIQIIVDFHDLPQQELHFLSKLFFDHEIKIWRLSNISICAFSDNGFPNSHKDLNQQTSSFGNIPQILRHQLLHIMNIFTDQQSIISLQLIVYFQLQNDSQKYHLNFKINNFISYLDEYQRWFSKDRLENFNCLLSIYCKQQNLYEPNTCKTIIFQKNEFATKIVAKLIYALKNHYYLIRSIVGYKLISMKDVINKNLIDQIIDGTKLDKNKKIQKERQRTTVLKQLKNDPIILIQHQNCVQPKIPFSTQKKQQINTEEIIHEQNIVIQESKNSHEDEHQKIQKQLKINQKSYEDSSQIEYHAQSTQRHQKKQYTAINNRNTMISPRSQLIDSSHALIKNNLTSQIRNQSISEFTRRQQKEPCVPPQQKKSEEEYKEQKERSQSEIKEFFPEFQLANLDDFKDYQPKEGHVITFNTEMNMQPYFQSEVIMMRSEVQEYINEFPDNYLALNLILMQNNTLLTAQIVFYQQQRWKQHQKRIQH